MNLIIFPTGIPHIARSSSFSPTLVQRLGLRAGPTAVTALLRSLTIQPSVLPVGTTPRIVMFWHGGMLVPWWIHRDTRAAALVSASRDGDVLAAILDRWGIAVVRGSSSAGGSEAVLAMVKLVNDGFTMLITPDGPRGPADELKIGGLVVAQRTGAPVVLCAPRYHSAWRLKSWDRFQVPIPFSNVDLAWSAPQVIPAHCIGDPLELRRVAMQHTLREMHVAP